MGGDAEPEVESSDPQAIRIDAARIATLSLAVFSIVYLITRGQALRPDDPASLLPADGAAAALARQALARGFAGVMLYGGLGAWVLATASLLVFGARRPARAR